MIDGTIIILAKGATSVDDFVTERTTCIELDGSSRKMYAILKLSSTVLNDPARSVQDMLKHSSSSEILDFSDVYISVDKDELDSNESSLEEGTPAKRAKIEH